MAFVVFSPHTFSPSSHCRQLGSPESPAGFPAPLVSPLQTLNFLPLCENCLSSPKAFLPHHERVSVCEAKADTLFHFTNVERLLSCSSGRLLPASWVLVPGPLSVAGCLEIDEYRCLLGTGSEFWTGRESLLEPGPGGGRVWRGERKRERE